MALCGSSSAPSKWIVPPHPSQSARSRISLWTCKQFAGLFLCPLHPAHLAENWKNRISVYVSRRGSDGFEEDWRRFRSLSFPGVGAYYTYNVDCVCFRSLSCGSIDSPVLQTPWSQLARQFPNPISPSIIENVGWKPRTFKVKHFLIANMIILGELFHPVLCVVTQPAQVILFFLIIPIRAVYRYLRQFIISEILW